MTILLAHAAGQSSKHSPTGVQVWSNLTTDAQPPLITPPLRTTLGEFSVPCCTHTKKNQQERCNVASGSHRWGPPLLWCHRGSSLSATTTVLLPLLTGSSFIRSWPSIRYSTIEIRSENNYSPKLNLSRRSSVQQPLFNEATVDSWIGAVDPIYGSWTYSMGFLIEK
jgi:hypothetical protein